jgi:ABC-2 type transport system permease protein
LVGYLFFSTFFLSGFASMRNFFNLTPILLVVLTPALTMKFIAEEKKSGTIEQLLTLPISDTEVVLGKFMALVGILKVGLLFTLPYAICVSFLGAQNALFDWGPVIGGYFGLVLQAAALISIGLFASSLTENQIIAFIIGLFFNFCLFFIDKFAIILPQSLASVFQYLSIDYHFANIARGVIDSRDLVYYISLIGISLMLTIYSLKTSKG